MSEPDHDPDNTLPENLRPLGARVLVKQKAFSDVLKSGLIIPQGHRMGYEDRATVIALGSRATVDVKKGDTILFKRQAASALHPDSREPDAKKWQDYLLLDQDNVLAVLEDDSPTVA